MEMLLDCVRDCVYLLFYKPNMQKNPAILSIPIIYVIK